MKMDVKYKMKPRIDCILYGEYWWSKSRSPSFTRDDVHDLSCSLCNLNKLYPILLWDINCFKSTSKRFNINHVNWHFFNCCQYLWWLTIFWDISEIKFLTYSNTWVQLSFFFILGFKGNTHLKCTWNLKDFKLFLLK